MMRRDDKERKRLLERLQQRLLAEGGCEVDWRQYRLRKIVDMGRFFTGEIRCVPGPWDSSLSNATALWGQDIEGFRLAIGYALDDDDVWKPHAWVMEERQLIETAEPQQKYFGVILKDSAAANFWQTYFFEKHFRGPLEIMANMWLEIEKKRKKTVKRQISFKLSDN